MKCTKFIEDLYKHKNQNEYSTHHEFSNSTTSFEDNNIHANFFVNFVIYLVREIFKVLLRRNVRHSIEIILLNYVDKGDKMLKEFKTIELCRKIKCYLPELQKK